MKGIALILAAAAASAALAADEPLVKGLLIGEKASPSCRASKLPYSLGMARYTMWNTPFDRALDITEALECRYMSLIEGSIARDASDAEIAAYKARLAKRGITVDTLGPVYYDDEKTIEDAFAFAKRYGMKMISVVPFEKRKVDGKETRVESDAMLDVLERLVRKYDIKAGIHNHGPDIPYLFPTGEKSWNMVKDLDARMGLCLDMGHDFRAKANPADSIRRFHTRIYDMHIKNVKFDPVKNRAMPMPRGDMNMWEIVNALVDMGYDNCCSLEYESFPPKGEKPGIKADEVAESIGYFKGLMKAIEG